MESDKFQVRRAVIDDLAALTPLWQGMNFTAEEQEALEKRLTDIQVATDGQGTLLGAVAFEVAGQQGRIHHEAFHDFSVAEHVRQLLWDRIRMLAQNNLVFRVWSQENAPFWKQAGLQPAEKTQIQNLPAKWSNNRSVWLCLQLKQEAAIQALSGTTDVELLMKMEREKTRKTLDQARMLKVVATVVAIIFAMFVVILILYAFKHDPTLLDHIRNGP